VFLFLIQHLTRFHDPEIVFAIGLRQFRREKISVRPANDVLRGASQAPAEPFIDELETPIAVLAENALRQVFHQGKIQRAGI
jgi:hypothetical protein